MSKLEPTDEQITNEQIEEWLQEWLAVGLSTDPADMLTFRSAVDEMYRLLNLDPPEYLLVDSPAMAMMAMAVLKTDENRLRDRLGERLWVRLGDRLGVRLWDRLRVRLGVRLRDRIEHIYTFLWGSQDSYWCALYDAGRRIDPSLYTPADNQLLDLWCDIARSSFWWWPYDNIVIVSDRPCAIKLDNNGEFHSEVGAAIAFRDGYEEYAIHGVFVEPHVVNDPDSITLDEIMETDNLELRRVLISMWGEARYVEAIGATLIDEGAEDHPIVGLRGATLHAAEVVDDEPLIMLRLLNSTLNDDGTRDIYWVRVPPDIRTVLDAVAWHHNIPVEWYRPLAEA